VKGEILVLPQINNDGELDPVTFELLGKGRELANKLGVKLAALLLGHNLETLVKAIGSAGVDTVLVADHPGLADYNAERYLDVVSQVVSDLGPSFLLAGYTYEGIEIGPAVAVRCHGSVATNCIDLQLADGAVRVVRPMFSGSVHARVELQGPPPYIISFQKGVLPKLESPSVSAEVANVSLNFEENSLRSKVAELLQPEEGEVDITRAECIVAVGRGIGDADNISIAKDLADALGGTIACSRPVVDLGWLPSAYHVGISGKTVAPKVYIACGISGASQHKAGIGGSKRIIAINRDPTAPIFDIAHYGVVGDLFKIIPEITRQIRKNA
jgi:electron transfer flavoprotein alpha subunit